MAQLAIAKMYGTTFFEKNMDIAITHGPKVPKMAHRAHWLTNTGKG